MPTATTAADSAAASSGAAPVSPIPYSFFMRDVGSLGLGYAIAISIGFLALLFTIILASYICFRASRRRDSGPVLPRVTFVSDDDSEDNGGGGGAMGLDLAAIGSYPRFAYSAAAKGDGDSMCSICLSEYREGEMMRMMPECRHCFHLPCIDAWLRINASCPVCRTSPLPTPVSTPLSELVPLSRFSADRWRG